MERLLGDLTRWAVPELRACAQKKGPPSSGPKAELVSMLHDTLKNVQPDSEHYRSGSTCNADSNLFPDRAQWSDGAGSSGSGDHKKLWHTERRRSRN